MGFDGEKTVNIFFTEEDLQVVLKALKFVFVRVPEARVEAEAAFDRIQFQRLVMEKKSEAEKKWLKKTITLNSV